MRLLLVEDNPDFAADIEKAVRPIQGCELVWARSRDSALARLAAELFDLVILDRRIPTADGVLDDHADHGWRVFQSAREVSPGTPVWFLTGTEDADFATEINNDYGRTEDIHGRQVREQMYQVFWKKRIVDCVRRIKEFADHLAEVERIAVRNQPDCPVLTPQESRAVRLFGRRYNGTAIDLTSLNGGLTKSRVLKVTVRNAADAALITAAAKVSSLPFVIEEAGRYQTDITRLTPGGYPPLTLKVEVGAGNSGGLFYGMVGEQVESLFHRIASGHECVPRVPADIRAIERPWDQGKIVEDVQVGQIRRRLIGDAALHPVQDRLEGIDIAAIEARPVRVAHCCQHGDLHCANVVFDQQGRMMLIDFGDVGLSFAALDPVTLELSTVFHSQRSTLPQGWPSEQVMGLWVTVEQFCENCAFAPFIMACREWALADAGSPEEVVAVAYAYAMRQLKYADTDKVLARALIRACIAHLVS